VALGRSPISLARSTDDGKSWTKVADLDGEAFAEFSYPAMVQSAAGTLEITYTWKRTHIKHLSLDPKKFRG
jgi:predicted neuraminidase